VPADKFGHPGLDLQLHLLLLFDRGQGLRDHLGRRLAEAPLAGAPEIMRRLEQAEQGARLLLLRGGTAEIVARQVGKTELLLGRELPGQFQLDALADRLLRR
jgi:hypothetical protein